MTYEKTTIIKEVEEFVSVLLLGSLSKDLKFHNLNHTTSVVNSSQEIASALKMNSDEKEIIAVAAWFHDIGHIIEYNNHEFFSVKIAREFLEDRNWNRSKIDKVMGCIKATKMPQTPQNLLEMILCDADLHHLGSKDYFRNLTNLRKEWEFVFAQTYSDKSWFSENIVFLQKHSYFTTYSRNILEPKKQENIELLQKRILKG